MTIVEASTKWVNDKIAAGFTSDQLLDPKCMLYGMPELSAVGTIEAGPRYSASLVAPNVIQFSAHLRLPVGWPVVFAGKTYTMEKTWWTDDSDVAIATLDRPVEGIKPLRILSVTPAELQGLPVFWCVRKSQRMQLLRVNLFGLKYPAKPGVCVYATPWPSKQIGTGLVNFDSGSPMLGLVDGELVLLCTAFSASTGASITNYRAALEAAMGCQYAALSMKPGDANDDGLVDFKDYVALGNNFGKKTDKGHNVGDFDHDGKVDRADFVALSNAFGT